MSAWAQCHLSIYIIAASYMFIQREKEQRCGELSGVFTNATQMDINSIDGRFS